MNVEQYRTRVDDVLARYRHAIRQHQDESRHLEKSSERIERIKEAQSILQGIAETLQQTAHQQIASIVTRCLETVFGDSSYTFRIDFHQKRGKTEADLVFIRSNDGNDIVMSDPADSIGGGVVDVAAFALRLACLVLSRPQRRKLLVMDEPAKHLSVEYRHHLRELLKVLAKEMQVQIVLVSHAKELIAGKIIRLER